MLTTYILSKNRRASSHLHINSTTPMCMLGDSKVVANDASLSAVTPKDHQCVELFYDVNKCFEKEYSCDDMMEKLCICVNNDSEEKSVKPNG